MVDPLVYTGDLHEAQLALEKVRPVVPGVFKCHNFSMLSVALVDFHDAMEPILASAAARDATGGISNYLTVREMLKTIEAERQARLRTSRHDFRTLG